MRLTRLKDHLVVFFAVSCTMGLALVGTACGPTAAAPGKPAAGPQSGQDAAEFVAAQIDLLRPLQQEANLAWYAASVSGSDADWARSKEANLALNRYWADARRFARARQLRGDASIEDPRLKRQIELMYLSGLGKQVDADALGQITTLQAEVEQIFNTYRGNVAGQKASQNQIEDILATSTDSNQLKEAWEAQKGVGRLVAPKLLALVELRNGVAKKLGFRDFYALRLAESELQEDQLIALFDELDRLTREPFLKAKADVDRRLADRLGIGPDQLMPWHYQNPFFQSPPDVFDTGLEAVYKQADTLALCRQFFDGVGLPASDVVERSDLYEKEGKTPHAFATDIDRKGDIRVLANIVPGLRWQSTMIHELGHAVYDKFFDPELPWMLRYVTHPLTTEGIAMMLDRLVTDPRWAEAMGVMNATQSQSALAEARAYQAFDALLFSRWTQVMLRFEREMYRDPKQDLDTLWWTLVERYQGLRPPQGRKAPDYASKIHLVVAPVYYQNYMLGRLFAAQVHEAIARHVGLKPQDALLVGQPVTR